MRAVNTKCGPGGGQGPAAGPGVGQGQGEDVVWQDAGGGVEEVLMAGQVQADELLLLAGRLAQAEEGGGEAGVDLGQGRDHHGAGGGEPQHARQHLDHPGPGRLLLPQLP